VGTSPSVSDSSLRTSRSLLSERRLGLHEFDWKLRWRLWAVSSERRHFLRFWREPGIVSAQFQLPFCLWPDTVFLTNFRPRLHRHKRIIACLACLYTDLTLRYCPVTNQTLLHELWSRREFLYRILDIPFDLASSDQYVWLERYYSFLISRNEWHLLATWMTSQVWSWHPWMRVCRLSMYWPESSG
jgi:hypothetical protein